MRCSSGFGCSSSLSVSPAGVLSNKDTSPSITNPPHSDKEMLHLNKEEQKEEEEEEEEEEKERQKEEEEMEGRRKERGKRLC